MSMAEYIAQRRKTNGMTQKQLADVLGVTDKAVSKWERGNGHPDIIYLEPLAKALGITVGELLKGKPDDAAEPPAAQDRDELIVKKTLDYAGSVYKDRRPKTAVAVALSIFILGLAGIITTTIVDFALNSRFTWSLLPISAIVYLWLCTAPILIAKKRKTDMVLVAGSVFLYPFLFILDRLTGGGWFVKIGLPMALAGTVLL